MNWITLAVLGAVAAWFEYNYQRSRRKKKTDSASVEMVSASDSAHVESPESVPSIVPGDENDKQMNAAI